MKLPYSLLLSLASAFTTVTCCLTSTALAQSSFAVNFTLLDGAAAMDPAGMAGEASVMQANWNNLTTVDGVDSQGAGTSSFGELPTVMDKDGKELKGLVVQAGEGPNFYAIGGASYGFAEADLTLHSGMLRPEVDVNIQNIPYAKYDVYVYGASAADSGSVVASCSLEKGEGASGEVDLAQYYMKWSGNNGEYLAATSTEAKEPEPGNCFIFRNVTATNLIIRYKRVSGNFNHGIAGFQIVEVK